MEEARNSSFMIHVPQGRSARLMKATLAYGIEALHTDGFSTCNIIVCIGQDKITLTHSDLRTNPSVIKDQIRWVGEPNEAIIIARENEDMLLAQLLPYLEKEFQGKKFTTKRMDKQHDGVVVSFNSSLENTLDPRIKKLPIGQRPKNLLHHPQEEKFLAVQKIEQVIGLRATNKTNKTRNYQQLIFDGRAWEPIDEEDFIVRTTHQMTKEEMDFFRPTDTQTIIGGKLMGIIQACQSEIQLHGEIKELAISVAFYLESYLNKFDALMLFKRNIRETITCSDYIPISNEDKKLKSDILNCLDSGNVTFEKIQAIFIEYENSAPTNEFKKNICSEFHTLSKQYRDRMLYRENDSFYQEQLRLCRLLAERGIKHYQQKEYSAASVLFWDALKKATYCCLKDNEEFAKAYYNMGRNLQQEAKYKEAQFFLNTALILRQNYVKSTPAEIEKIQKALQDCRAKIEQQNGLNVAAEMKPPIS